MRTNHGLCQWRYFRNLSGAEQGDGYCCHNENHNEPCEKEHCPLRGKLGISRLGYGSRPPVIEPSDPIKKGKCWLTVYEVKGSPMECDGCGREVPIGRRMISDIESCCGGGCCRHLCESCVQQAAKMLGVC